MTAQDKIRVDNHCFNRWYGWKVELEEFENETEPRYRFTVTLTRPDGERSCNFFSNAVAARRWVEAAGDVLMLVYKGKQSTLKLGEGMREVEVEK